MNSYEADVPTARGPSEVEEGWRREWTAPVLKVLPVQDALAGALGSTDGGIFS